MQISIYQYSDPRQFLLDLLSEKQRDEPTYSVRRWAKDMGMKSHSLLVMLLQGKRPLRAQHCDFLQNGIELNTNELTYFQTLIHLQNAKTIQEQKTISTFLDEMHPGEYFQSKEVSEFLAISDWRCMALLAMTELKGFRGSEKEIYEHFDKKVPITKIRSILGHLLELKLIKRHADNTLKATYNRITTKNDISNEGAKEYHRQVIDLAKNAIDKQSPKDREFQSFALSVADDKIDLAKDMIRKFRSKLSKAVSGDGDQVYQTNIQFFQLTKNPEQSSEETSVAMDKTKKQEKLNEQAVY